MLSLSELSQELDLESILWGFDETDFGSNNEKTLIRLNTRLEQYLKKVEDLKKRNEELQTEINAAEKSESPGLGSDQTQEILETIKNITEKNAELLLEINNCTKNKKKLEEETIANQKLESELDDLNNVLKDTKTTQDLLKEEIAHLNTQLSEQSTQHQNKINNMCKNFPSEENSQKPKLSEIVRSIRKKYEKITEKNMTETETWYNNKFKNAKEEETLNLKELDAKTSELMKLREEKKSLEMDINTLHITNKSLTETRRGFNEKSAELRRKLERLIEQTEAQQKQKQQVLDAKENLQDQIQKYKKLVGSKEALEGLSDQENKKNNDKDDNDKEDNDEEDNDKDDNDEEDNGDREE